MAADDSVPGSQLAGGQIAGDLAWLALWFIAISLVLLLVLWPTALLVQVFLGGDIQPLLDAQTPIQ